MVSRTALRRAQSSSNFLRSPTGSCVLEDICSPLTRCAPRGPPRRSRIAARSARSRLAMRACAGGARPLGGLPGTRRVVRHAKRLPERREKKNRYCRLLTYFHLAKLAQMFAVYPLRCSLAGWPCSASRRATRPLHPTQGRRARGAARSRVGLHASVAPAVPSEPEQR